MNTLDSERSRVAQHLCVRMYRLGSDTGQKVVEMSVRRVCESQGIRGRFANALNEDATEERCMMVAEYAGKGEDRLGDIQLSKKADQIKWHLLPQGDERDQHAWLDIPPPVR